MPAMVRRTPETLDEAEIERRKPVWFVLSWLWLDTELAEDDLRRIAAVMWRSGYSLVELREIYLFEVAPVVCLNAYSIAGEWAGFDPDWLFAEATKRANRRQSVLRAFVKVGVGKSFLTFGAEEHWERLVEIFASGGEGGIEVDDAWAVQSEDAEAVLDRFSAKLSALRAAYDRDPRAFDVGNGFVAGPPLSEEQIREVESRYGVVLPPQYRGFLKRYGDMANGPGAGLFRMEQGLTPESGKRFPLVRPLLGCVSAAHRLLPEEERREDFLRLSRAWDQIPFGHGVLELCDYGCGITGVLVLNGPYRGDVWIVSGDAAYYGPFGGSEALHDVMATDAKVSEVPRNYPFFAWYESWLDGQLR